MFFWAMNKEENHEKPLHKQMFILEYVDKMTKQCFASKLLFFPSLSYFKDLNLFGNLLVCGCGQIKQLYHSKKERG